MIIFELFSGKAVEVLEGTTAERKNPRVDFTEGRSIGEEAWRTFEKSP